MRERGLKYIAAASKEYEPESLPMRERGLKWQKWWYKREHELVAPHAGAWIEMLLFVSSFTTILVSLPMRERGLKYAEYPMVLSYARSLPMRERGLKFIIIL